MFPGSISYTSPSYRIPLSIKESRTDISLSRSIKLTTYPNSNNSLFGWLVADGWCWFVLREEYCWLVAAGCCWLVRSERKVLLAGGSLRNHHTTVQDVRGNKVDKTPVALLVNRQI
jgi:hypothetical protein